MTVVDGTDSWVSLAQTVSLIGKGGAYVALCAILSAPHLWARLRSGGAFLEARLNPGERLAWLMWSYWVFGTLINQALKFSLALPRPWWLDPSIAPLSAEPSLGFGMPSGHAQGAVGVWLLCFALLRAQRSAERPWPRLIVAPLTLCCALWVPLTMWARVTLHAHSLAQVCAGAGLGLLWSLALWRLSESRRGAKLLMALGLLCVLILGYHMSLPSELPESWLKLIEAQVTQPLSFKPKLKVVAALSVATLGLGWAKWRDEQASR